MDLEKHLEHSIWTIELEHAIEVFSLPNYLNWFDYKLEDVKDDTWLLDRTDFPENFLRYLEHKVSEPCSQTEFQLQLLILDRENLTFITTICCVIWSILPLPSTNPQLEKNSNSCTLFGLFFRNPSHRYGGVWKLQVGKYYVPNCLVSMNQRWNSIRVTMVTDSCMTQQHMIAPEGGVMTWMGQGMDSSTKLEGIFLSLSCLFGLPVLPFHAWST